MNVERAVFVGASVLLVSCAKPASSGSTAGSSEPLEAAPAQPAPTGAPVASPIVDSGALPKTSTGPLARALAGRNEEGIAWIPKNDNFSSEDLLVMPDGTYITHLHQRPDSSGRWWLEDDVLTLSGWYGDGTFVIRSLRIQGNELRGIGEDGPIVMRRFARRR